MASGHDPLSSMNDLGLEGCWSSALSGVLSIEPVKVRREDGRQRRQERPCLGQSWASALERGLRWQDLPKPGSVMQAAVPCPSVGCSEGPDKEGRGDKCSLHTHIPQYVSFPLPFLISSHSTTVFCWVTTLEHTWSSYISRCTCPQWGVQSSGDVERHTLGEGAGVLSRRYPGHLRRRAGSRRGPASPSTSSV